MFTQCPDCLTIYKVDASTLGSARARVRCGTCASEFDALATLADSLPDESILTLSTHPLNLVAPQLTLPALRPKSSQGELFVAASREAVVAASEAPGFARRRVRETPRNRGWVVGVAALALLLIGQLAWSQRERIIRDDRTRPWVESACARLGCTLPLVAATEQITLVERDVRPHPSVKDALVITATLVNQAAWAQPFPVVEITLSDPNEKRVAMRRFRPETYMSDASALAGGFAPGVSAPLRFEVADPGKNAIAFEFRFLNP